MGPSWEAHILGKMFRGRRSQEIAEHKASIAPGRRIFAVGDIHGRKDLLTKLLARIGEITETETLRHTLVFLGDYVDRGPDSAGVLDELGKIRDRVDTVLLKGNHETFLFDFLRDPDILPAWANVGGLSTLASYGLRPPLRPTPQEARELRDDLVRKMPESHVAVLRALVPSYAADDYFFVHAGVRPGTALADQAEADLLWIRGEFLDYRGNFEKRVVHGHTPVKMPDVLASRINIDTGAFATGNLTCLVLEADEISFLTSGR